MHMQPNEYTEPHTDGMWHTNTHKQGRTMSWVVSARSVFMRENRRFHTLTIPPSTPGSEAVIFSFTQSKCGMKLQNTPKHISLLQEKALVCEVWVNPVSEPNPDPKLWVICLSEYILFVFSTIHSLYGTYISLTLFSTHYRCSNLNII